LLSCCHCYHCCHCYGWFSSW